MGGALVLLAASGVLLAVSFDDRGARAHGSVQAPVSRAYTCYLELTAAALSPACQAALDRGGSQAFYDWNGINRGHAGGEHRLIPDGQLCSAGNAPFAGFDLPRADWPATTLAAGASYEFRWRATAPHKGGFEFYLTRPGYDPKQPLRWSDLDSQPFLAVDEPPLIDGSYVMRGTLPTGRTGRHLIYTVYQRTDSPEAFYACSDVVFGGQDGGPAQPPPHEEHTESPSPTPVAHGNHGDAGQQHGGHHEQGAGGGHTPGQRLAQSVVAPWQPGTAYAVGARVSHNGQVYVCRQAHTTQPGWEPPLVAALWLAESSAGATSGQWQPQTAYPVGALVTFDGRRYVARQGHVAQPGWEPPNVPALWHPQS
ncbi:lytic polysaccharide monooxygenase [Micromonospora sp. NPDC047527]|uniref:lytic polysaccharide monooxygenase n=1 Tax=Micromonospora sp. NPDC047527 TaxID=3155144 RepID=UPI0033E90D73